MVKSGSEVGDCGGKQCNFNIAIDTVNYSGQW